MQYNTDLTHVTTHSELAIVENNNTEKILSFQILLEIHRFSWRIIRIIQLINWQIPLEFDYQSNDFFKDDC